MSLLAISCFSAVLLTVAYLTYGPLLGRLLRLRDDVPTPAVSMRDDVDYEPIDSKFLLSQHFSAIAAAGPVVGPIMAGVMFGWLPALIWILVGSVFIGGVHDMTALVASIRHKARSIAEVVRDHMTKRSYVLFLMFVWLALVYIIVAFTDVTAEAFVGMQKLENGQIVSGGGIATSSLLYLALPVLMGLLLRYTKLSIGWATLIFLPLVGLSIWAGQFMPFDVATLLHINPAGAKRTWNAALMVYCLIASVLPMWLLLQPRGHLGGYFLYIALAAGMLGVMFGGQTAAYPMFKGWEFTDPDSKAVSTLFPMLFITIACGACSGFHSIIASGTTSKQLRRESDAKLIGYGSMLLEAMVAIISLFCVMRLGVDDPLFKWPVKPNNVYAQGIGSFMQVANGGFAALGLPYKISATFAVSFGLMAFTTFVYDTLDVCTRLGRYILQELTGMQGAAGRWLATGLTAGVPLAFLLGQPADAKKPLYAIFWNLFGASNQLLAALTLLGVTVWLWRTRRAAWVLVVTGIPCVFMYIMSMWALMRTISPLVTAVTSGNYAALSASPVPWVASLLAVLGLLILIEAVIVLTGGMPQPPLARDERLPVPA